MATMAPASARAIRLDGRALSPSSWSRAVNSVSQVTFRPATKEVDQGNDPALELYRGSGYKDHERRLMAKRLFKQKAKAG